ncbi:MAG: hypothetical protein IMF05_16570 [Proteobacteria bacterium]|nr:hypothetical protein [Pseudomonadota bacterium]
MRKIALSLLLVSGLFLVGCGASEDNLVEPTGDRLAEISAIVDAVDWSKAEARSLVLDEFEFLPSDLTFRLNQPYELTLSNEGIVAHRFVSSAFFDAIAVKGLVFSDGEVSMPLLKSVSLEAGEANTLIFVPVRAGVFPFVCDRPLHETFGMEGAVRIE